MSGRIKIILSSTQLIWPNDQLQWQTVFGYTILIDKVKARILSVESNCMKNIIGFHLFELLI